VVEEYWQYLERINSNYYQACLIYSSYLKEIRNNEQMGNIFLEKAFKIGNGVPMHGSLEKVTDNALLFNKNTTIVHMSGNKDSYGKIMKCNKGLENVFGYTKNEVVGHSVNLIIP
jgi:hypothetical protein